MSNQEIVRFITLIIVVAIYGFFGIWLLYLKYIRKINTFELVHKVIFISGLVFVSILLLGLIIRSILNEDHIMLYRKQIPLSITILSAFISICCLLIAYKIPQLVRKLAGKIASNRYIKPYVIHVAGSVLQVILYVVISVSGSVLFFLGAGWVVVLPFIIASFAGLLISLLHLERSGGFL